MFFFFISIFGIFDIKLDKKCLKIDYHIKVKVSENSNLRLSLNNDKNNPINLETKCEYTVINNNSFIDETAKKRLKILKISKIVCWLLLIGIGIFLTLTKAF